MATALLRRSLWSSRSAVWRLPSLRSGIRQTALSTPTKSPATKTLIASGSKTVGRPANVLRAQSRLAAQLRVSRLRLETVKRYDPAPKGPSTGWDSGMKGMAEEVGFEPTRPCGLPVFKTSAIDHSATPPWRVYCPSAAARQPEYAECLCSASLSFTALSATASGSLLAATRASKTSSPCDIQKVCSREKGVSPGCPAH